MKAKTEFKKCLVVSYGPVPTEQYQTIEGGGMRAWGLAKGLRANGIEVTIAINESFPQNNNQHQGINLVNWTLDDQFADYINTFDAVIASYCMGDPSVFIADRINNDVQLFLDVYVPIYIEVSARDSEDVNTELRNYLSDIDRFNHVLRRGDYFLCANQSQKVLYLGVLSSLGVVNPRSYRQERILIAPFGIHGDEKSVTKVNPYKELGIDTSSFIVLWFGGLYPWFRVDELLGSLLELSRNKTIHFVFVGGKNPFNPNPDFARQYNKTVEFTKQHGLINSSVHFVDWVDFDKRIQWFYGADVVISLNQPGEENGFSWRTRVMDFVWGEVPIITNGGDPLSEELIAKSAAVRLTNLSTKSISKSITDLQADSKILADIKSNLKKVKLTYYWDIILKPLSQIISDGSLPFNDELVFKNKNSIYDKEQLKGDDPSASSDSGRSLLKTLRKVVHVIKRKGLVSSIKLVLSITSVQLNNLRRPNRARQFVFIGHPMDNTGAPLVLIEIIKEFAAKYGGSNVKLITPAILSEHRNTLDNIGVKVYKSAYGLSFRMIRLQLGVRKDDFVLMNTIAIYDNYREFVFLWLRLGRLKCAYWFIHEDKDQIPVVNHTFLDKTTVSNIKSLTRKNKLKLLVPSERVRKEYDQILDISTTKVVPLRVHVDKQYSVPRKVTDYKELNFLLSGTPSDGRKGQLIALAAFSYFLEHYFLKSPELYREFKLHLVNINEDYISKQIKWVGSSLLENHLVIYPGLPFEEALKVTANCNAVICCSLNETFGLYIAEGMHMGHIVLRNDTAGIDEQLDEGNNGYFIDHTNVKQFASILEKILNKKSTSDNLLHSMGKKSQKMISNYSSNTYISSILDK